MFKIESYITPLLMGYVDKYVKLRPEDFQLSLWGGDAVLHNLDLRLDVIEKAMQLPIVFQSGHIHELRLHVPWSKIWSEPVVVTINTIECILKLRDTAYSEKKSRKAGSDSSSKTKSGAVTKSKVKRQDTEDLPPGYLQSMMNKIVNNVSIIVNNLIVKFVEDDIVLSLNVKSAECYSVDKEWNRAFVELSPPDFVLQKVINFCDLTVCLDKRNASGRIQNYQDPLAYRCSLLSRLYLKYDGINAKFPSETKLNFYCERLELSLTDTQLPMLIRLVEMCLALYYGTMDFKNIPDSASSDSLQEERSRDGALAEEPGAEESVGEPPPQGKEGQVGWAQWAWSYVPQILPDEEENTEEVPEERRKPQPPVFSLGMYAYKLTVMFKVTEHIREKAHYGPRKVVFKPFLYLESEGISMDVLLQGVTFFNCQFGITSLCIFSQGPCICGADGEEGSRNHILLSGGDLLTNKTVMNYMTQSLFDPQGSENLGIPVERILDWEEHLQVHTEQYGMQKYGVFWMDYLYTMATQEDSHTHSSRSSVSDSQTDDAVFIPENSVSRFLIGQCHLNLSSTTVHRVQKFIACAKAYDYEPYAKTQTELVDEDRPHPTEEQIKSMEEYIPTRTSHLTLFQPIISILSAEHAHCDVAKKSYKSKSKMSGNTGSAPGSSTHQPLFGIQLSTNRFDLQVTSAMYPRKLVRLVSKIAGPSSNLLHHCHSHTQIKLFGFHAGLMKVDVDGSRSSLLTVLAPTSGAMYTRKLLLPMYWKNSYLPKAEHEYELPQISASLTKPGLLVVMEILTSWQQATPKPSDIKSSTLLDDVFPTQEERKDTKFPVLELTMSGFEMKTCRNAMVTACTGTVSSLQMFVYTYEDSGKVMVTPILYGSTNTENLHLPDWLSEESSPVSEDRNDCFTFTYQLPRTQKFSEAPAVVLLNLEGISCCVDPVLMDWLNYSPRQTLLPSRGKKIQVDLELAKAASPLQHSLSQVSQASSGSTRQQSETLTFTKSPTPVVTPSNPAEGQDATENIEEKEVDKGWGKWLAKLFPLVRMVQVQVEVKKLCCFLFKSHLRLSEPSSNVPHNLQELARSRSLPEMLVVCFPHVHIQSQGLKPVSFLQEIPIRVMEGSLVGDKLPWNVNLRNFSVYTVHNDQSGLPLRTLHLVHPATVNCTVAVSFKCSPPTSDNISALGLCLHTDMHAVTVSACLDQVTLIVDVSRKLLSLGNRVSKVIGEMAVKLKTSNSPQDPKGTSLKPPSPVTSPRKSNQFENSTTEPDGIYTETSGDLTSLDTTPSRELEIIEMGGEGVRLSLWLQWTLPKCQFQLFSSGPEACKVSLMLEDNTISVDVQDVYAKVKVKVGSINMKHFTKKSSGTWEKGMHEGILMSCHGDLSHDTNILSVKPWSGDRKRTAHQLISAKHAWEINHGFLNLTFTRALRKNVKQRFQKLNVELPNLTDLGPQETQFHFYKYVSEICVNVAPCDFVFFAPSLQGILRELTDSFISGNPSQQMTKVGPSPLPALKPVSPSPLFTSSNLPLIYADIACVRVFVPSVTSDPREVTTKLKTTLDHDMILIQVKSVNVAPQADNPLPRYPVQKEIYQRAVQTGVTKQPGSAMLDRQYEIDVKGFSVCTGCWSEFVEKEKMTEVATASPGIQIPAVEWNGLNMLEREQDEIVLFPLVSGYDIKLVAAPAIVNVNPNAFGIATQKSLVCGYSMEINITTDLDLHISVNQIHLLERICSETVRSLTGKSESKAELSEDSLACESPKQRDSKARDSGLGSDVSAITIEKQKSRPLSQQPPDDLRKWVEVMTPVDVLLTAGRISCTVYSHKVLEKDFTIKKESEGGITLDRKARKTDLEWQVNPELDSDDEIVYDNGKTAFDLSDLKLMNIQQECESEAKVIPEGSTCIVPFFYAYISQPHTLLSCSKHSQKFEMSCYDVLVKGPVANTLIPVSENKLLSDYTDYGAYWLETRAGQSHPVTGIPPCLYTLSMTNFLIEPVCVSLKLERPMKVDLNFTKIHQVRNFLEALLPKQADKQHRETKKQPQQQANGGFNILKKVRHLELQTDQIVVAMETKSCDQSPCVIGSFSSLRVEAEFNQTEKGQIESVQCSTYIRDLLMKTRYYRSTSQFLGPVALKMDATINHCFHSDENHLPPQVIVTIATGLMMLNIGQEQVLCLKLIMDHALDLVQSMMKSPDSRDPPSETNSEDSPAVTEAQTVKIFIVQTTVDDLRTGRFQYIMDPDNSGMSSSPGEIIFCEKNKDGNSTMTWSYNQPRVISLIQLTPIPFDVEEEEKDIQVRCSLQYWEALIQQFVDYIDLEISEREVTTATLPDINAGNSRCLIVAQTWRVVIKQTDGRCIVHPSSLAASMRVDTCYVPCLIPSLQVGVTVESLELHCCNHLHCLNQDIPTKLKPYFIDSCVPASQEFAVVKVDNILVASSHLTGSQARTQSQFSCQLMVDVLEYRTLTMQRVISPFEISGQGYLLPSAKPPVLDLDVTFDPVTLRVGRGVVHTLSCSVQGWSQLSATSSQGDLIMFGHYMLCNDTQHPIRFGQVGTDENMVLQPREMHPYSWRSHKTRQSLHLCVDGTSWKWCDPFDINKPGTVVRSVKSVDQQYTLMIRVSRLSNVQNQIVISGQLLISNRLTQNVEVKVITATTDVKQHRAIIGAEQSVPSYIIEPSSVQCIRFRPWGVKTPWSKEVYVVGEKMKENFRIKFTMPDQRVTHVWCRVFTETYKSANQILLVLCPLYIVRSHLPIPLYINIDTPKLNQHARVESPGQGQDTQLQCMGGDIHHSVTFQFSPDSDQSSTAVTLSTGLIDQLDHYPVGQLDLQTLYTAWQSDQCWDWPYSQDTLDSSDLDLSHRNWKQSLSMNDYPTHPTIDLNVSLSEFWPGCGTVLVDVAPWCLLNNCCDLDLVILAADDRVIPVQKGQTVCPPKFEVSFQLGVRQVDDTYSYQEILVSSEELSAQRYRTDIGKMLYLDSFVHTVLVMNTDCGKQLCFLTLQSSVRHQMRVITVRERLYISNLTRIDICINPFTVPQWSNKVPVPMVTGHMVFNHAISDRNHSNLFPVTYLPLTCTEDCDKLTNETIFIHYLSVKCVSKSLTDDETDHLKMQESDWSFPARLTANENGTRTTLSVQVHDGEEVRCKPLCISGHVKKGISYFVIREDAAPQCLIRNFCPFPLVFGQKLMNLTLSGTTVQEETELVTCLPAVPPGGGEVYYTSPYINSTFPEIKDGAVLPKLHFAGALPDSYSQKDGKGGKAATKPAVHWSVGVDLKVATDTFLSIPDRADTKVHIEHVAMVTCITIEPISKAEVSAREIRSRLKGKEKTIHVESKELEKHVFEEKFKKEIQEEKMLKVKKSKSASSSFSQFQCHVGIFLRQVCVVLQDELSSPDAVDELLRVTADGAFVACYPASAAPELRDLSRTCFTLSVEDFQIDNQVNSQGNYDFPVVLVRQDFQSKQQETSSLQLEDMNIFEKHAVLKSTSLLHLQVVMATTPRISTVIETLELSAKPLSFYVDDAFIFRVIKELEGFIPSQLSAPTPIPISVLKLPPVLKCISHGISSPVMFKRLCIQPCSVLLSVHASLKLFIALDHTPLSFGKFEKLQLTSTSHQLIRALAMHYASGALFRAGAVVGSLEILGNPTGLIRSIGTGVADFFRLPYNGLTRGPGAFVVGVSGGTASLVKNISTGMLTSVTNFASSISRNMDRLSMDNYHQERQEQTRRHRPDGISDGLKQGLTGLGLSLLGAVAGLADQPIQNIVSQQTEPGTRSTASSLVSGMGKGIVGVLTKPIGGAAEFVSQTGQGLLHGAGLSKLPEPRSVVSSQSISDFNCGQVKFAMKLLPSSEILIVMEATFLDPIDPPTPVTLVLTPDILFIINQEEDNQQQAFSIVELDCGIQSGATSMLTLTWRDSATFRDEQPGPSSKDRVAAFIDSAVNYAPSREVTPLPIIDHSTPVQSTLYEVPEGIPDAETSVPDNPLFQALPPNQGRPYPTVIQGRKLSDSKSDSSSSVIESIPMAVPQYSFQMTSTNLAAFMAVFLLAKHRLQGIGFAV